MSLYKIITALVLMMNCALRRASQLTPEQQAAKVRGITMYNQYKAISAQPYLKTAAEAGDRE